MAADTPRYFPDDAVPQTSPFSPGFGATPPYPVGRAELIRNVYALLVGDPTSEGGANMLLGPRGMGKTVMLNEIEDAAQAEGGWNDGDAVASAVRLRSGGYHCGVCEVGADAFREPVQMRDVALGYAPLQRLIRKGV